MAEGVLAIRPPVPSGARPCSQLSCASQLRPEEIILRDFEGHPAIETLPARAGDPQAVSLQRQSASVTGEGAARAVGRHELLEVLEDTLPVVHGANGSIARPEEPGNVSDFVHQPSRKLDGDLCQPLHRIDEARS